MKMLFALLSLMMLSPAAADSSYPTLHMLDLAGKYQKLGPNERIVDVRTDEEFNEGHVPGATHIVHTDILKHVDTLRSLERVYIYCRSGRRSQIAGDELVQAGLKNLVVVTESGMPEWIKKGLPVEK